MRGGNERLSKTFLLDHKGSGELEIAKPGRPGIFGDIRAHAQGELHGNQQVERQARRGQAAARPAQSPNPSANQCNLRREQAGDDQVQDKRGAKYRGRREEGHMPDDCTEYELRICQPDHDPRLMNKAPRAG
jgi:hypothetical protein